ncbi:hypothetical protein RFM41_18480 [Mesorhizobium sp. VK25A]|uniref:Uncharacterized protein n=1 Tax=Mesorhizobium vachelliae TaxID=3072309 RepID=A0ABU4ZVU6_9HYPH|nr:hypothetical protein [Mesorhizobium sp. VK25D]MDX8545740.1 hypothetical protein [Mesorhizobium sp. VK25A]
MKAAKLIREGILAGLPGLAVLAMNFRHRQRQDQITEKTREVARASSTSRRKDGMR